MTIEIYRDSHLYELPDDLRTKLRSAIVSKCHTSKEFGPDEPKGAVPPKIEES
jgi:hypothetical protein